MPHVLVPRIGTQQPPAGSTIDYSHPLGVGLVGLWAFNEGSGSLVQNLAGSGCDLVPFSGNPPVWTGDARRGMTGVFMGTGAMTGPYRPALNCAKALTIEVLTQISVISGTVRTLAAKLPLDYALRTSNATPILILGAQTPVSGSGLVLNQLHHLVGTVGIVGPDTATPKATVYTDGMQTSTPAARNPPANSSQGFRLGQSAHTFFKVAVYERALTADEVRWLYEEPWAMLRGPEVMRRYWFYAIPTTGQRRRGGVMG